MEDFMVALWIVVTLVVLSVVYKAAFNGKPITV